MIAAVTLTLFTIVGLCVLKSGLNIDLFDGPSPLHALAYGAPDSDAVSAAEAWAGSFNADTK
jgi:hypothetical protein